MLKVENLIESSAVQSFSTKGGTATAKEFIETEAVSALGLESVYPHADMTDSVALRTLPGGQVISKLFEEVTGLDRVQVVPNFNFYHPLTFNSNNLTFNGQTLMWIAP